MVLTDIQIPDMCKACADSLIVPFNEERLQSESYDLSIGNEIFVLKKEVRCIDLERQDEIDDIYEKKVITDYWYTLSPKEYILVTLKEKITLTEKITAHISPRTRFTRLGLLVSDQHCNSTYSGVLKLGII